MKKLTPEIAEKFAKEIFSKVDNSEDREFYLIHSKAVVNTAIILARNKTVNNDLLRIAGWLHDIGYVISEENHAEHSLEILEKEGFELNLILRDCILNHGSSGKPETEEGRIIKGADKVSILNPEVVDLFVKNSRKLSKEELAFLNKMTSKALDFLRDYEF